MFDTDGTPYLDWIDHGGGKIDRGRFPSTKPFVGLQILLLRTWIDRRENSLLCPKLSAFSRGDPIHSLTRTLQNPKPVGWRDIFFGMNPQNSYVMARGRINKSSQVTALVTIKLLIDGKDQKLEDQAEKILQHLQIDSSNKFVDVEITATFQRQEWTIAGELGERGMNYGCHFHIRAVYKNLVTPVILWISRNDIVELYPDMDPSVSDTSAAKLTHGKDSSALTIGGNKGIPLLTESGVDACLVVCVPKTLEKEIAGGKSEIRNGIRTFLENNPIDLYERDYQPKKRFFYGLKAVDRKKTRGLGKITDDKIWADYLLQEAMPRGTTATLLTIPVSAQSS